MSKSYEECTDAESLSYIGMYFATVDLLAEALSKYDVLASDASKVADRSNYRALALTCQRDFELLKNRRRSFLNGGAKIRPPSDAMVQAAEHRAQALAETLAEEAYVNVIIDLATKGLTAFNKLHA